MIYTSGSQALALLEMLVHLDSPELLKAYVFFEVSIEESQVVDLDVTALPKNWRSDPPPRRVQALGDAWVESATSVVLRVPSVIVPGESNFLLNPRHADFSGVQVGKPMPFEFDPRLSGGR
jgi:RES domain-containing protein